ncbi:hypothetical protein A2188_02865 [Candidatus Woesebacteria bacterium RIFOXYA1_FULL_43_9]|uniref:Uncharacterized protein n=1 Tax=Candidatus Woesebacteria bacterium RIFOXYA1_FULL_43_9 TaxID=1802534 RepID=A0A1F8CJX4_9BACT|nr:MAG: hypothetical protein A2188_02865 [Candidatus Woesebacteria bacterium RIFOXYA1_FULL_43_9]
MAVVLTTNRDALLIFCLLGQVCPKNKTGQFQYRLTSPDVKGVLPTLTSEMGGEALGRSFTPRFWERKY